MDYVSPCLIAEGPTDNRLLSRLTYRLVEEILFESAVGNFELADVIPLGRANGLADPMLVCSVVASDAEEFTLLLIHRDADARDGTKADPWVESVRDCLPESAAGHAIFVIPIRMVEAWILADGDALRSALGVRWSDDELGVPSNPADVESIHDPKGQLRQIVRRLSGPRIDVYERTADRVSLDRLRQVPAFKDVEMQLQEVLVSQGVIA